MPQFPYQVDGSVLQALCPELLVTHVHRGGGGTRRAPRGTFAERGVSALPLQLLAPVLPPSWALKPPSW